MPPSPQSKTLELDSDSHHLKPLREAFRSFLKQAGFTDEKVIESLLVALGEAFTNSIRHSYHGIAGQPIHVTFEDQGDRILFKVRDWGEKINLKGIKEPKLPPESVGGLGVYFMRTLADDLTYNTDQEDGNEVVFTKIKQKDGPR